MRNASQLAIILCLGIWLFIVGIFNRRYLTIMLLPCAVIFGITYTTWQAEKILAWNLPKELEGKPIIISGHIASLPVTDLTGTQFEFALDKMASNKSAALVRLSWRQLHNNLRVGDKWKLLVHLKRIHGVESPGSFDFEAWALQHKLRASGYVIASDTNILLNHHWYYAPGSRLRQHLADKIKLLLPDSPTAPWLMALIIGQRDGIPQEQWQVLRNTGTNHLMAIAGLHIGIIAGLTHLIISWLWRRSEFLTLKIPANQAATSSAVMMALIYSALAGFSIPTQRACYMLILFSATALLKRQINIWHSWSLTLLLVTLTNPLILLTDSFWLSFSTIALIIYGMQGRLRPSGWWWRWGRVQWIIGIGLIPLSLNFFQQFSLISFIANSIAIPWLGFLILPFCLFSCACVIFSSAAAKFFLIGAAKSMELLWRILTFLSHWQFATWQQVIPNNYIFATTILAFIFFLMPKGATARWLGILFLLPIIFYQFPKAHTAEINLTQLDVGQGLALVIQTKSHLLVYDAGPKFNTNVDMGENVVVPYLRFIGAKKVDMLVISHGDNDHIGGSKAIIHSMPTLSIMTSVPEKFNSTSAHYCLVGDSWEWDGVRFKFLYPSLDKLHSNNDSSCVLSITNGQQTILLPGDIEKYAENQLLKNSFASLPANILIAPHHGSKTSGPLKFIQAIHPDYVLYGVGYRNRYHFPHQSVVANYAMLNTKQLNTAEDGTIRFKLKPGVAIQPSELFRITHHRYWMDSSAS